MATNDNRSAARHRGVLVGFGALFLVAFFFIVSTYPTALFHSALLATLLEGLVVIGFSLPLVVRAFLDTDFRATIRLAVLVLVGVCPILSMAALLIAQTQPHLSDRTFVIYMFVTGVTAILWFVGLFVYAAGRAGANRRHGSNAHQHDHPQRPLPQQ